jgi:hypothetical protein
MNAGKYRNVIIFGMCAGPWERLGFLNVYNYLHVPGGDLCIFLELLIVLSFFVPFHTP